MITDIISVITNEYISCIAYYNRVDDSNPNHFAKLYLCEY